MALKNRKALFQILSTVSIYIFCSATTPNGVSYPLWYYKIGVAHLPLQILLISLSNDVHQNPGPPFHNSFFAFMSWNLNSLAKDDFQRVHLIEVRNSIFNYDFISTCETSLNDSITFST